MGLIILIVVGAILGWLASIVMRTDDKQGILLNIAVGVVGALLAGTVANNGSILGGISANALLMSFGGTLALLVLLNLFRHRVLR